MEQFDMRQKKALRNIRWAVNNRIGEMENSIEDYGEDDECAIACKELLGNHEALCEDIYDEVVNNYHDCGLTIYGKQAERLIGDIKFCGKAWLMEQIDKRVTKEGY